MRQEGIVAWERAAKLPPTTRDTSSEFNRGARYGSARDRLDLIPAEREQPFGASVCAQYRSTLSYAAVFISFLPRPPIRSAVKILNDGERFVRRWPPRTFQAAIRASSFRFGPAE